MEVSGRLHAQAALPPGKEPRYPLDRRLGGPQSRSGRRREETILDLIGTELRHVGRPARSSCYTEYAIPATTKKSVAVRNVSN
jgi:hypothetical protein